MSSTGKSRRQRGQEAESVATNFLKNLGYKIVERNFFTRFGEIDIICKDGDILVFVEVRSLKRRDFHPLQTLSRQKMNRILKAIEWYLTKNELYGKQDCRLDIIGVIVSNSNEVVHIKDAYRW